MDKTEVLTKLKRMLVGQLNLKRDPATIADDEPLFQGGLGLDSLDSLEIVVGIEREFKLKISRDNLKNPEAVFESVGSLASFISSLLARK